MKIMLIDDDKDSLASLSGFLKRLGYECDVFSSPQKAVEAYDGIQYDVVITDLKMPELDGYQVLKKLLLINPKAKVIIITGYGSNETAFLTINYGAHAFIAKPLNLLKLMDIIKDIVSV